MQDAFNQQESVLLQLGQFPKGRLYFFRNIGQRIHSFTVQEFGSMGGIGLWEIYTWHMCKFICHSEEMLAGIQETWFPPGHSASGHQDSTFHQDSYQSC